MSVMGKLLNKICLLWSECHRLLTRCQHTGTPKPGSVGKSAGSSVEGELVRLCRAHEDSLSDCNRIAVDSFFP